jgi:hypothetical protein
MPAWLLALPISYSSSRDTAETVRGVRQANARFTVACFVSSPINNPTATGVSA